MLERLRRRGVLRGILAAGVLGVLAGGFWFLRRGNDSGVEIRPSLEYPVGQVVCYGQKDERWSKDRLGESGYTMGGSGCLTSCIASALSCQYEKTGIGCGMTAGELNEIFSENQVYNGQGDIVWDRIGKALPGAEVLVASSVKEGEIQELLEQGRYPVVKVKVGGHGAAHWVLLVGSENGEYVCMDPLSEDGELISLDRHGGVVYRMRCVYWRQ